MLNLSQKQTEIVNFVDGAILVKAGPGSGKTRVLIERIKKLLTLQKRCRILALTFSNLAAEEMKNRLQEDGFLDDYLGNAHISTIHSFCLDLVQTRGYLIGLPADMVLFESNDDKMAILKDIFSQDINLLKLLNNKDKPEYFLQKCLSIIIECKKQFISPEFCSHEEPFPEIYKSYNQALIQQNALDFDDILFFAYRILIENPNVTNLYNKVYRYICVDEAQDLNKAQYQILKALCGESYKNIMLVGDENQSIYGFNGSNSSLMSISFVKDFDPHIFELNENFRSAKSIVEYADSLVGYTSKINYAYNGLLEVCPYDNEKIEAETICEKIEFLLKNGHPDIENSLSYDNFAIIARNRYVLAYVENIFMENNVPFFYKKSTSVIESESDAIKIFDLCLRILINPRDIIHLKDLCTLCGVTIKIDDEFSSSTDTFMSILNNTKYSWLLYPINGYDDNNFEFGKILKNLEDKIPENIDDDERYMILNDIFLWKKHWKKYYSQVLRENRSLLSFRNYISLGKTQDITEDNGVALLTAHMSKGLQFEVIFVIGLGEGTFPDYRAINAGGVAMEQEKNNMYVAVTRAKRLCYLSYPKMKLMPWGDYKTQFPSRFLQSIIQKSSL